MLVSWFFPHSIVVISGGETGQVHCIYSQETDECWSAGTSLCCIQ